MLSDAKARAAKPRPKPYKLTDSNQLFLLVTPSGGKLWRWNYKYDGKQKCMAFGAYPLVSLADARGKRDEASTVLCEGHDPNVVKKLKIEENIEAGRRTFERVAREWHENAKAQWAKIHAADIIRSLERDVFPTIGALPIVQLTPPLVLGVLREIEARGSIETAKCIRQRISAVFVYGIAQGSVQTDPAEKLGAVLKPLRKGRQPAITDLVPLRKMIIAAEEDYARPITRLALRLLALTSVRPSELRGARWDEFEDLNDKLPLWRIPASRMKGDLDRKDEQNGDHLVPITPQALAVLKALWPLTGEGELLFPSNRHTHRPMSENAIGYLLNRAGYHGHHVPHGFRAAFSTIMNEWAERDGKDHDRKIIDLMLAHVPTEKWRAPQPCGLHATQARAGADLGGYAERRTTRSDRAHRSSSEGHRATVAALARPSGRCGISVSVPTICGMKSDNSSWQTRASAPPSAKLILRRLLNAHDRAIWARQEGFADLRPSIWHLSVALIKERANRPPLDGDLAIISPSEDRRVVRMGELIALAFDAPKLSKRHDLLRRGGCSWDFVVYHPHVSFTPFDGCFTREVRPFDGPLIFGPEVID